MNKLNVILIPPTGGGGINGCNYFQSLNYLYTLCIDWLKKTKVLTTPGELLV